MKIVLKLNNFCKAEQCVFCMREFEAGLVLFACVEVNEYVCWDCAIQRGFTVDHEDLVFMQEAPALRANATRSPRRAFRSMPVY
jgi:hypothetical protein